MESTRIISPYYKMTDVSTYIEAEEYVEKIYDTYYGRNSSLQLDTHTTIYNDHPLILKSNNCTSSYSKNTLQTVEYCKIGPSLE